MDSRKRLPNGKLILKNADDQDIVYYIDGEIGRGGSSVVYSATYMMNTNIPKKVRIKECYPFKLTLTRLDDGTLVPNDSQIELFEKQKERMVQAFKIGESLYQTEGATNAVTNQLDIYYKNNTVYIVSAYDEGTILSYNSNRSFQDIVSIVLSLSNAIKRIHEIGYLYLDIKPDNIFVLSGRNQAIKLFDFDSIQRCGELSNDWRISYTRGFSPVELILGNAKKISKHTDVFSLGSVFFYLLFNRTPMPDECDVDAQYEYEKSILSTVDYNQKLFKHLDAFFHKTLANYCYDRYSDLSEAILELENILKYADVSKPFVYSTESIYPKVCFGREKEIDNIHSWYRNGATNCLFVEGEIGIGKSTLVRRFCQEHRDEIDVVLYVNYDDSIVKTVCDDSAIKLNNLSRTVIQNWGDYFKDKVEYIKEVAKDENILLVIDNYKGDIDQDFIYMLQAGWKVIVVSDKNFGRIDYDVLTVGVIEDVQSLKDLYEYYREKHLSKEEKEIFPKVLQYTSKHTFNLILIARQLLSALDSISLLECIQNIENANFANIAEDSVTMTMDGIRIVDKPSEICKGLISDILEDREMRSVIKAISIFGAKGISLTYLRKMSVISSNDIINALKERYIVQVNNGICSLSSFMLGVAKWIESDREKDFDVFFKVYEALFYLWKTLRSTARLEEYPKTLGNYAYKMQQYSNQMPKLKALMDKFYQRKGAVGELTQERVYSFNYEQATDYKELLQLLILCERVLSNLRDDPFWKNELVYLDLLARTILEMPYEMDDTVYDSSSGERYNKYYQFMVDNLDYLTNHKETQNDVVVIDICEKILGVYLSKNKLELATEVLNKAERIAEKSKKKIKRKFSDYILGKYYSILGDYYDYCLDGHYEPESEEDEKLLRKLQDSVEKAIFYMRRSNTVYSAPYLAEYLITKATLIIRSGDSTETLDELFEEVEALLNKHCLPYSRVWNVYHLTKAWYFTYIDYDVTSAREHIARSKSIVEKTAACDIDYIDKALLIHANIYLELQEYEDVCRTLFEALRICGRKQTPTYKTKHDEVWKYITEYPEISSIFNDVMRKIVSEIISS